MDTRFASWRRARIEVTRDGQLVEPVLPVLRELAEPVQISALNANGNKRNTRQLGSAIIRALRASNEQLLDTPPDDDGPVDI